MSEVEIQFVGIPNAQEHYSGDGLELDMGDTAFVDVSKAHQVLKDHPTWFKPVSHTLKEIGDLHAIETRRTADAPLGFRMVDDRGGSTTFPPGTKITIEVPGEAPPKKAFPKQHRCEMEDCNAPTKKDEKYCKKHKEKHAEA